MVKWERSAWKDNPIPAKENYSPVNYDSMSPAEQGGLRSSNLPGRYVPGILALTFLLELSLKVGEIDREH